MTQSWLIDRRYASAGLAASLHYRCSTACVLRGRGGRRDRTPRRSAFVYLPNGVNTLDYQITTAGKDYTFSRSLKPLEKHRDVVTPISGLHHPGGLGHHHNCQKIWLTGGQLGPSDRNTISVDQRIAEVTAPSHAFSLP